MRERSLSSRAFAGFVWVFAGTAGKAVISAVTVVVLARLLTPAEFGIVSAALVVTGFTQIFTAMGVGPALVHLPNLTQVHLHVAFTLSVALGSVFALLLAFVAPAIGAFFRLPELESVIRVLALAFPIAGATTVGHAMLQRAMSFRSLAIISFASFVGGYGAVGILLAWVGWGVWALVFAHMAQTLVNALLVLSARPDVVGMRISRPEAAELLVFGIGHSLARVANYTAVQGDNAIVGRVLGAEALGAYGRAYQIVMVPVTMIGTVLDKVLFPVFSSIQADKLRLTSAFLRSLGIVAMITLPMSVLLAVTGRELVLVLLGPQWSEVTTPLQVLMLFLFFRTGYKVSDSLARATGAVYRRAWRQWAYAAVVLVAAWIGLTLWGTAGVALGVGVAVLLNFVLMLHLATSIVNVGWLQVARLVLRHLVVTGVVAVAVLFVRDAFLPHEWSATTRLVLTLATGLATWFAVWFVLPRWVGPEGADALRVARHALTKRAA